ncbi:hypothetical protein DEV91_101497 [Phyllobacterium brassicacearum]|nr:hypothetical protein DEV91_101497 [Phyllobacterium brassicacearum]
MGRSGLVKRQYTQTGSKVLYNSYIQIHAGITGVFAALDQSCSITVC